MRQELVDKITDYLESAQLDLQVVYRRFVANPNKAITSDELRGLREANEALKGAIGLIDAQETP